MSGETPHSSIRVEPTINRWLVAALAAVVAPKCVLCLAGYLAAGGAVVELCGGVPEENSTPWLVGVTLGLALIGAAAVTPLGIRLTTAATVTKRPSGRPAEHARDSHGVASGRGGSVR